MVERQLCKLDVRGSNPLASISKEMEAKMRTDGSTGLFLAHESMEHTIKASHPEAGEARRRISQALVDHTG